MNENKYLKSFSDINILISVATFRDLNIHVQSALSRTSRGENINILKLHR